MGFVHIATVSAANADAGTTLDADTTLNIAAGDLLVTLFLCSGNGDRDATIADTSSNNVHTMAAQSRFDDASVQIGYVLVGEVDAVATIRVSSDSIALRGMVTYQFRPDGGDEVTLDQASNDGDVFSAPVDSGDITTTGDDEVVVGGAANATNRTYSNQEIGGVAADSIDEPAIDLLAMYTIYAETKTDIAAIADMSADGTWAASILSFKAVGGAPGVNVVPLLRHRRQMVMR